MVRSADDKPGMQRNSSHTGPTTKGDICALRANATKLCLQWSIRALAHFGVRVIDNTPDELCELVIEMINRLEGRHVETAEERATQAQFAGLGATYQFYPVKIARAFMSSIPSCL